jgi:hypothetical protein
MEFDTKVAIIILDDLAVLQKLNVTAFLATGIAGAAPDAMGDPTSMPPAEPTLASSASQSWSTKPTPPASSAPSAKR